MFRSRASVLLLSFAFALAATIAAAYYLTSLRASISRGQTLVDVVIAKQSIRSGTSVAKALATGSLAISKVPKQYVAENAIASIVPTDERILSADLAKGEQLTESKLRKFDASNLAFRIPEGMIAVAIEANEITGVGGELRSGDRVDVLATFSPGPSGQDETKIALENVEILATRGFAGREGGSAGLVGGSQSSIQKKTVTLAVSPSQAEKLVLSAEKGRIWLALRRAGDAEHPKTSGQTVRSVFD